MDYERLLNKQAAIDLRVAVYGKCLCDYCHERPGAEYHEIIRRAWTVSNEEARRLSFEPPCCSLLCHECHQQYAPTRKGEIALIDRNIELYGLKAVREAFYAIPRKYWKDIQYDFERNS